MQTYYQAIEESAKDFLDNYKEEIDEIIEENKNKDKEFILNEAVYQKWCLNDKILEWLDSDWYSFLRGEWCDDRGTEPGASAKILEESKNIETDSGLWEGKEPMETVQAQAFFTARNDLLEETEKQLKNYIDRRLSEK